MSTKWRMVGIAVAGLMLLAAMPGAATPQPERAPEPELEPRTYEVRVESTRGEVDLFNEIEFTLADEFQLDERWTVRIDPYLDPVGGLTFGQRYTLADLDTVEFWGPASPGSRSKTARLPEDRRPGALVPFINLDLFLTPGARANERQAVAELPNLLNVRRRPFVVGTLRVPRELLDGRIDDYFAYFEVGMPVEAGPRAEKITGRPRFYSLAAMIAAGFIGEPVVDGAFLEVPVYDWPQQDLMVARRD